VVIKGQRFIITFYMKNTHSPGTYWIPLGYLPRSFHQQLEVWLPSGVNT